MNQALIDKIFDRHEPGIVAAATRSERFEKLLDLHEDLARHAVEDVWLELTDAMSAGRITLAEFCRRLENGCCDLFRLARGVQERHGYGDRNELMRAAWRITNAYFSRSDEISRSMRGHGGRA